MGTVGITSQSSHAHPVRDHGPQSGTIRGHSGPLVVPSVLVTAIHCSPTSCCRRASTPPGARRCCARAAWSPRPVGSPGRALGRPARRPATRRTPGGAAPRDGDPVVLVPGLPGRRREPARADGARAARAGSSAPTAPTSTPTSAARCTPPPQLEARLESIALRRGRGSRSSGTASAACSPAASPYAAPTWSSGIVTLGSPMLAPGRAPRFADRERRGAGPAQPGRRARPDGARTASPGDCARQSFDESRAAGPAGRRRSPRSTPGATASSTGAPASTRWRRRSRCAPPTSAWPSTRACIDQVVAALRRGTSARSALEVDRGRKRVASGAGAREVIERIVPLRERITSDWVVRRRRGSGRRASARRR